MILVRRKAAHVRIRNHPRHSRAGGNPVKQFSFHYSHSPGCFFFDPEVFLRFRDKVIGAGIATPLIPGLLPILNFERAIAF